MMIARATNGARKRGFSRTRSNTAVGSNHTRTRSRTAPIAPSRTQGSPSGRPERRPIYGKSRSFAPAALRMTGSVASRGARRRIPRGSPGYGGVLIPADCNPLRARAEAALRGGGWDICERGGVRADGAAARGAHDGRERGSGVEALLRSGAALRTRPVPARVVYAGRDQGQSGEGVPAGQIILTRLKRVDANQGA